MKKIKLFILTFLLFFISSCTIMNKSSRYPDASKYHALPVDGEYYDDSVKIIDLSWLKGDVNIISSNEYQSITLYEQTSENLSDKYLTHVWHDGKYLYVKYAMSNVSFPNRYQKSLTIYIPGNLLLEQLIVDNASGNITISNVNFESINVKSTSGNCQISETYTERLIYSSQSGNLSFKVGHETQYVAIDTKSGNSILSIPNNTLGFSIAYNSVSGNINTDYPYVKENDKYVYLDASYFVINYKSTSGSITILTYDSKTEPVERKSDDDISEPTSEEISDDQSNYDSQELSEDISESIINSDEFSEEFSESISELYSIDFSLEVISDSGSWGPLG